MAIFGLGFLAGSRSGKGAWNAFENKVSQLQNRNGGDSFGSGSRSMTNPDNGNVREGIRAEF
jgi:hypothetical protein